jgi:hypothetical protein
LTRGSAGVGVLIALGLTAGALVPGVGKETNPPTQVSNLEASETHAGASLLGQFRTSVAASLFMRADLYLHNGVEMRALTEAERRQGEHGVGGSEDAHIASDKMHDDSSIVTVVPGAKDDFRGVFGDIERATSAYKDMRGHDHNDPLTVMPLYRFTTWIDPSFISGWCLGAMVMARGKEPDAVDRAIAYLKEGRKANPDSIEITTQIGTLYIARQQKIDEGLPWLEKARELVRKRGKEIGIAQAESAFETYRWLALVYRHQKRADAQHAAAREGLLYDPEDKVLKRMLE